MILWFSRWEFFSLSISMSFWKGTIKKYKSTNAVIVKQRMNRLCVKVWYTNFSEFPVSYSQHDKGLFKFLLQNKLEDLHYCTLISVTDRDVLANSSYPHLSINLPQFVETIFRTSPLECELFILQIWKGLCHTHKVDSLWHDKRCTYIIK